MLRCIKVVPGCNGVTMKLLYLTVMTVAIAAQCSLLLLMSVPAVTVVHAFVLPSSLQSGTSIVTSLTSSPTRRLIRQSATRSESATVLHSSLPMSNDDAEGEDYVENSDEEDRSTVMDSPAAVNPIEHATGASTSLTVETHLSQLEGLEVQTLDGSTVQVGDLMARVGTKTTSDVVVVTCLSHYGDYNAWELTQQYMTAIKGGRLDGDCQVILVGIGSVESANTFAKDIGLMDDPIYQDRITLATDETGCITEALQCYRGWLTVDPQHKERYPQTDIDPTLKLLGMIFGLGSPGTIPRVIEGYTGDVSQKYGPFGRRWVVQALKQGSEKGRFPQVQVAIDDGGLKQALRPFELATLRLQTGLHIVAKWNKLGPKDGELFTRMGGTFVFSGEECIWEHFDKGILSFANMDDICQVADAAVHGGRYVPPMNSRSAAENRRQFWARKEQEAKEREEEAARLAAEARLEQMRLAEEARLAEERRLEEIDRIEQEKIAEIARQGQEAKKKRLEAEAIIAEEARLAEETKKTANEEAKRAADAAAQEAVEGEKIAIEAAEYEVSKNVAELASKTPRDKDEFDLIALAKHEELLVAKDDADHTMESEVDDRSDVVASVNVSAGSVVATESEVNIEPSEPVAEEQRSVTEGRAELLDPVDAAILKAEEQEKKLWATLEALKSAPRGDVESSRKSNSIGENRRQEAFQRSLLAARIQYESSPKETLVDSDAAAREIAGDVEAVSRNKDATANSGDEAFQRKLLEVRLHYEAAARENEGDWTKKSVAPDTRCDDTTSAVEYISDVTVDGARIETPKENDRKVGRHAVHFQNDQEKFQRKLLSARLHYEKSAVLPHSNTTEDEKFGKKEPPSSEIISEEENDAPSSRRMRRAASLPALLPDEAFS